MLSLLPERFRLWPQHRSYIDPADGATSSVHLTSTQVVVRDALVTALQEGASCIVLTGAASVGKTTVLTAALARVADLDLQVLRLDDAISGMEDAFQMLFAPVRQRSHWRQPRERRIIVVMDQAEAMPPGIFEYLDLLNRMPGKEASLQWVFAGQAVCWDSADGPAAQWLREVSPVRLTVPALSERDAWELFHYRVVSGFGHRSAPKLVAALLQQSRGLPGRFDAVLRTAIAAGLLKGVSAQAA